MEEKKASQQEREGTMVTKKLLEALEGRLEDLKEKHNITYENICAKGVPVEKAELDKILKAHDAFLASINEESGADAKVAEKSCRAILDGTDLSGFDLDGVNLAHSCMADSNLDEASLCDARLQGADLQKTWLDDADLCGADLSYANLRGAHLCRADLSDADMREADLSDACFCRASLDGTKLAGANLHGADFAFVDWWGADFSGIDLRNARNLDTLDVLAAIAAAHGAPHEDLEYGELQAIVDEFIDACPQINARKLACEILEMVCIIKKMSRHGLVDDEHAMFPTFKRLLHEAVKPCFNVVLEDFGDNKISAIKAVREITGLGLKETKELVESAPALIAKGACEDEANFLKSELEAAGCSVSLK